MSVALSVVVPVYDEVEALPALHEELLDPAWSAGIRGAIEIVYVDDGSTDGTGRLLEKLHADRPDVVRVVTLRRNFGKSGAMAAGFHTSRGRTVVTLDADGQDVPGQIPRLLALLEDDADVAIGWRRSRHDRPAKRWASRVYNRATRMLSGLDIHDFNTGLKAYRREVVEELPLYGDFHRFVPVLAANLGFQVAEVAVEHRPRSAGTSKFRSPTRFIKTVFDLMTVLFLTRFGDRPLYLLGGAGAALSTAGIAILAYLSLLKLVTGAGIGTRPLLQLGVVLTLVGVQLVSVGFLGDMVRHATAREEVPYRIRRQLP